VNAFLACLAVFALMLSVAMPVQAGEAGKYPQTEFKRMQLRVDGVDLVPAWPWEEGAERGRYVLSEPHE